MSNNPTATVTSVGGITNHVADGGFTRHTGARPVVGTLDRALQSGQLLAVYDGNTLLGQATVAGQSWVFSDRRPLSDGQTVAYSARLQGTSTPGPTYRFTVDTSPPPNPTIQSITDDVGAVRGALARGDTTDDTRLLVRVGLSAGHQAGGKLTLFDGETALALPVQLNTTDISRGWKEISTPTLAQGRNYALKAVVSDLAGNEAASDAYAFAVASTARNPVQIARATDRHGDVQGTLLSGATTDDRFLELRVDLTNTHSVANDRIRVLNGSEVVYSALLTQADINAKFWTAPGGFMETSGWADRTTHMLRAVVDPRVVQNGQTTYAPGLVSDAFNITLDTNAPSIERITDNVGVIQGAVVNGGITDDRHLSLRIGLWHTDAVVGETVYLWARGNAGAISSFQVTASDLTNGFREVVLPALNSGSTYAISAALGANGWESEKYLVTVDAVAPFAPTSLTVFDDVGAVQGALGPQGRTDDRDLVVRVGLPVTGGFTGRDAVAGDTVLLMDGQRVIARATLDESDIAAKFKDVATPRLLAGATYSLAARLDDVAGNQGVIRGTVSVVIDTTAPNAPTIVGITDDVGAVQGLVDRMTDDTQLQVRISVAGTNAMAGDTVELIDRTNVASPILMRSRVLTADDVGGKGYVDLETTTLSGGTAPGGRQVVLHAQVVDVAGNRSSAASRTVVVDTVAPNAPTIVSVTDDVGRVQGPVADGGKTDDLRPVVRIGLANTNAVAGDTVRLFSGIDHPLGDGVTLTATDISNRWVEVTPPLAVNANYALNARIIDGAGNSSAASAQHLLSTTALLSVAPVIVSVADDVGPIQGLLASGSSTDDTQLLLSVKLNNTGAVAGDSIEFLDGEAVIGSAFLDSVTSPVSVPLALQAGAYELSARVLDANGRVRTEISAGHRVTVDTTAPAAPTALRVVDDFGPTRSTAMARGASTDDVKLTVYVSLPKNGDRAAGVGDTVILRDGATVLTTVTLTAVDIAAGVKEIGTPDLTVGTTYELNASIVDAAGNQGAQSTVHPVHIVHRLIDAPSIVSVSDDVGASKGALASGAATDDAHLTVRVKLSETNAQADDFVMLYDGSALLRNFVPVKLTADDIVKGFRDVETPLLPDAAYALNARIADNRGNNTGASAAHAVTVDTTTWVARTAPVVSAVFDDVGTIQGSIPRVGTTDDTRPLVYVNISETKAQPDDWVFLYNDRAALDLGTRITGEHIDKGLVAIEAPALTDGQYVLRARIMDRRGNLTAHSMPHTITVDTTVAPIQRLKPAISSVIDDEGVVKGVVSKNGVTDDRHLTLRVELAGTNAVANDSIQFFDGGSPTPLATLENGITLDDIRRGHKLVNLVHLSERTYDLNAVIVDNDGPRASDRSDNYRVTVDRTAPGAPRISEVYDDVARTVLAPDALTTDRTPRVTVDLRHTGANVGDTLILRSGGQPPLLTLTLEQADLHLGFKQVTLPTLANGQRYDLNAVIADPAGNWSVGSPGHAVLIRQAPPQIQTVVDDVGSVKGNIGRGGLTDDTTPTVRVGLADTNAKAGDSVVLFNGSGAEIGSWLVTAAAVRDGWMSVTTPVLAQDEMALRAAIRYGSGPSAALSAFSNEHTLTVDATASNAPTISSVLSGTQTPVAPGSRTDVDKLWVTIGFAGDASVRAGDILTLRNGTTVLMTTTLTAAEAQAGSKLLVTPTLVHGNAYALNAVLTDAAGNQSAASATHAVTVNQLAPSILSVRDDQGLSQGALAFGAWTDDARPTFRIGLSNTNARANDKVALYSNGTPITGAEFVLTGTDISRGYKDVDQSLTDGSRSISAAVLEGGLHRSRLSAGFTVRVDTTAPTVAPEVAAVSASGKAVTREGHVSADQLSVTLNLGSSAAEGDTVTLRAGSTELLSEVVTAADISNARTKVVTTPALVDGTGYALNALLTDRAGNRGSAGTNYTVHIDKTAPDAPDIVSVTDDQGLLKGPLNSGDTSDDNRLLVRVSLDASNAVAGDSVQLYDGNSVLGSAVVLSSQHVSVRSVDIVTPLLNAGRSVDLNARVVDRAGNVGAAGDSFAVTIDRAAPTVSAVQLYAANGKPLNDAQLKFGDVVVAEVVFDSDLALRGQNVALDQFSASIRSTLTPAERDGLPTLLINMGGKTHAMSLQSMSETGSLPVTEKLTFTYTLQKDQTAVDEIWVGANALLPNIYTLHDPAGNAANLTHAWSGPGVKATYGTAENDRFVISRADIEALKAGSGTDDTPLVRIDGGGGIDALRLIDGGMVLDLTQIPQKRLQNIERIDMTSAASASTVSDELRLTAADVLDMSGQNHWNVDGNVNVPDAYSQLMVTGNASDRVYLDDSGWARRSTNFQHEGQQYQVWTDEAERAQVLIPLHMSVFNV